MASFNFLASVFQIVAYVVMGMASVLCLLCLLAKLKRIQDCSVGLAKFVEMGIL